ncbi:MAG: stage II sporulation protein E [Chloroflexota bacterium]
MPDERVRQRATSAPNRHRFRFSRSLTRFLPAPDRETVLFVILAFFLGRARIADTLSPFGIAFFAAACLYRPKLLTLIGLAVSAGALSTGLGPRSVEAVVFVAALPVLIRALPVHSPARLAALLPGISFVVSLATGVGTALIWARSPMGFITALFQGVTTCLLALIFMAGLSLITNPRRGRILSGEEVLALVVLLAGAMSGMASVTCYGVSLRDVFGAVIIISAALVAGSGLAAAIGVTVGLISSLSGVLSPAMIGTQAFAGLLAGIFKEFGKWGAGAGYLVGYLIFSLFMAQPLDIPHLLIGQAIGLLIVIAWPRGSLESVARMVVGTAEYKERQAATDRTLRTLTSERLKEFGRVFEELARSFEQIASSAAETVEERTLDKLLNTIASRVCNSCPSYRTCWDADFYRTYKVLIDMLALAEQNGGVAASDLDDDQRRRCVRLNDLLTTVNYLFEMYRTEHFWQKRVSESREIVSGQLRGISQIMTSLASEIRLDVEFQDELEDILAAELTERDLPYRTLSAVRNAGRHVEVTLACEPCDHYDDCARSYAPVIGKVIGQTLGVEKCECSWRNPKQSCLFKLYPTRAFDFRVGVAKRAKAGGLVNGDTHLTKELRDGKLLAILSDGMGNGPRAAMESRATIGLLDELVEVGFDVELAVRTVNSILVLRSPEEIFATVDLIVIDLHTGEGGFIKIGACPTYIVRSGEVTRIKLASLPLGILNSIDVEQSRQTLRAGDLVIMVSDGVLTGRDGQRDDWLIRLLKRSQGQDPQAIADEVLTRGLAASAADSDDMTVVVIRIEAHPD